MSAPLRIGLAGLGTVGAGVGRLLHTHAGSLSQRAGRPLALVAVSARDRDRDRGVDLSGVRWVADPVSLAHDPGIDVVVEVIGGADGVALHLAEAAAASRRPLVTANKALLAAHGSRLARAFEAAGVPLAFEAAVAGGIPIIKTLREGLAGNRMREVIGILNGTCNYILTQMRSTGQPFEAVLAQAQALGYAEADPSFDVDGIDTAHKLAILAATAFGAEIDLADIHIEGIRHVSAVDIAYATELGFRVKLLGIARHDTDSGGLELRVHPCLVPGTSAIAAVDGVFNAVIADGDAVGSVALVGRGAGAGPTASAVVADLVDIAHGRSAPTFGISAGNLERRPVLPMRARRGRSYLRLMVEDRPGVIAEVAAALRDEHVSMESFLQRGRSSTEAVPVVLTTHETEEAALQRALTAIAELPSVLEPPCHIRIEDV